MVFVHMVWFEWRDDAPAEEISAIGAALTSLKGRIPGVVDVSCECLSHGFVLIDFGHPCRPESCQSDVT